MYQLFTETALPSRGEQVFPEFRRVREGLKQSVERIRTYNRDFPKAVLNTHILVKLLMGLNVSIKLDPQTYNDKVRDVAFNVARSLNITTALAEGRAFSPGVFYGDAVTEVIWGHIDDYDMNAMRRFFRDMRSVVVLYHPRTDLALEIPDGKSRSLEAGMAVISVNIPMLATQYRLWREEQNVPEMIDPRSVMQFIADVVLPNMLESHVDIAVTNRIINQFFDVPVPPLKPHHPFYLTDWSWEVDQAGEKFLEYVSRRALTFDQIVHLIPTVFAENYSERLNLPDLAYMRQVQWAVIVSRMTLVLFLVQLNYSAENQANRQSLNYLRRYLTQMDQGGVMRAALSTERREDIKVILDTIRRYV